MKVKLFVMEGELATADYAEGLEDRVINILEKYDERIEDKTADMHIRNWNVSRAYAEWLAHNWRK